ncbi:hypothetical protein ACEYYA_02375 [Paracoccus sp. p3-h83]|uniref:hypothetical protein n=1 Tax=Paracoccus sp. p3-h83 TaxID=3342805 RepID=UPI0035BA1CEC
MTYMHHVTLLTGHVARQKRADVTDDAVAAVADLLDAAIMGGHPALPIDDGVWLLNATTMGRALIATIWRGPWERRVPIITIGVAPKARVAMSLWRVLHDKSPASLATTAALPPPAPWVADRIEPTALMHPEALLWTGDFSRCLGWAWMEYSNDRAD